MTNRVARCRLLTLPEAAERLRRSEAQLRWMRSTGSGPPSAKIGGRIMYREDLLESFIEEAFAVDSNLRGGAA